MPLGYTGSWKGRKVCSKTFAPFTHDMMYKYFLRRTINETNSLSLWSISGGLAKVPGPNFAFRPCLAAYAPRQHRVQPTLGKTARQNIVIRYLQQSMAIPASVWYLSSCAWYTKLSHAPRLVNSHQIQIANEWKVWLASCLLPGYSLLSKDLHVLTFW